MIIIVMIMNGCELKRNNQILLSKYPVPNMDSLINSQIGLLKGKQVSKLANFDGQEESITLKTDTTFWSSELSAFNDLEINKPSLVGAYRKSEENSNSLIFTRKEAEKNGPIQVIVTKSSDESVLAISGIIYENNIVYTSEHRLALYFDKDSRLIKKYRFSGFQKLISKDTVLFEIIGEVR